MADGGNGSGRGEGITLRQLRVFTSVAHAVSLTSAAKDLGLTQPTLSQQIQRLEQMLEMQLFERRSNKLTLTEAGRFLLRGAEPILARMSDLEEGLAEFSAGRRQTVRVAGINSIMRMILPAALAQLRERFPLVEVDIQEAAPGDVLDLLYERRASIGLLSSSSIAQNSVGFQQVAITEDPYVLAVPERLDLAGIVDPAAELDDAQLALLNSTIRFVFGTPHDARVESWFQKILPEPRPVAHCRTFEVAVSMVEAGIGIALLPALSAISGSAGHGMRLYPVVAAQRQIVALVPTQLQRVEPYRSLLETLAAAGSAHRLTGISEMPPFLARAAF